MDDVRATLDRLIRDGGADYAALSRLLGRNAAYIQQFIRRGIPRRLAEDDRRTLACYFGVGEELLGGSPAADSGLAIVPRLDVRVSAGPGGLAVDESNGERFGFDERWLRALGVDPAHVSAVRVGGDSMAPALANGDNVLVDTRPLGERLREGIYVLRLDDVLNVKRLAPLPGRRVRVISDNPAYPPWEAALGEVIVIGRVVWVGRKLV